MVVSEASPSTKATLGLELRAPDGTRRPPHRVGARAVRARQPGEGRVGSGRAVRQHRPRPARGHRALRRGGVPVSVTAPGGFVASGVACGIKASGAPDLALVASTAGAVPAAGVFTANLAAAAPVQVSRAHLAATAGHAAAVVLSSGNANAATGAPGWPRRRAHVRAGGRGPRRGRRRGPRVPDRAHRHPAAHGTGRGRDPGAGRGAPGRSGRGPAGGHRHHDHRHRVQGGRRRGRGVHGGGHGQGGGHAGAEHGDDAGRAHDRRPRATPTRLAGALRARGRGDLQPDDASTGARRPTTPCWCWPAGRAARRRRPSTRSPTPWAEACGELAGDDGGRRRGGEQGGARGRDRGGVGRRGPSGRAQGGGVGPRQVLAQRRGPVLGAGGERARLGRRGLRPRPGRGGLRRRGGVPPGRGRRPRRRGACAPTCRAGPIELRCDLGLGTGTGAVLTTDLGHGYIDENRTTS